MLQCVFRFYHRLNLPVVKKNILLVFSLTCALMGAVSSCLYYGKGTYTSLTWIGWVISLVLFPLSFYVAGERKAPEIRRDQGMLPLFLVLTGFFFLTHLWNFGTAPWNQNGLFDDAAWNIYFALKYIFSGAPFQAAFFDHAIAREVIFHYYISVLFNVFGYNLLTFNLSVLFLGFVTYIFTILLVHRLFHNKLVTVLAAAILNFFPLHYLFCFVGQRYSMVPPLMVSSLYFLHTGYLRESPFRISVAAVLAGLCFSSGIMGKQYLLALAGALPFFLIFNGNSALSLRKFRLAQLFVTGTVISALPMIIYIIYNPQIYFANESNYTRLFFETVHTRGLTGLMEYVNRMTACLFGTTYYKWFIPDYPLIPLPYYLLLIPGAVLAVMRKQIHFVVLAVIPALGAFISGFSDYRVLIACPLWVSLSAYTLHALSGNFNFDKLKKFVSGGEGNRALKYGALRTIGLLLSIIISVSGIASGARYVYTKSQDPYSVFFFAQKDVAVSRYLRDIVAGVPDPSPGFRMNEFRRLEGIPEPEYETLICQNLGYAITHTFLYYYDDRKILSFSDQLPYNLLSTDEILNINKRVIAGYRKNTKDLKLIWEITEKTREIVAEFKKTSYLGSDETVTAEHEGRAFSFYILNIKNDNIEEFKEKVRKISL